MKKIKANILRTLCLIFLLISCDNQSEWIYLFDGKTTDGWRAYNGTDIPEKWAVVDGELTFNTELKLEEDWIGGADIIYFKEQFESFELHLDRKSVV